MNKYIINGILENCFNGIYIIRGYVSSKLIAKLSKINDDYQRKPDDDQIKKIVEFLNNNSDIKFMPEVVLSYDCSNLRQIKVGKPSFKDSVDNFYTAVCDSKELIWKDEKNGIKFQRKLGSDSAYKIVKIVIQCSDGNLKLMPPFKPFVRIDGNHRIIAFEEIKKDFIIPYCIILNTSDTDNGLKKFEMEIFHNVNGKVRPLSSSELSRGLFELFTPDELQARFGIEYRVVQEFLKTNERNKELPFEKLKGFQSEIPNILVFLLRLLRKEKWNVSSKDIFDVLGKLNYEYFDKHRELCNCKNKLALIPFFYFCYLDMKAGKTVNTKVGAYISWFIRNKLYDVEKFNPQSMIDVFNALYNVRRKQIFVAMPFDKKFEFVFTAICEVVEKINKEKGLDLPKPQRVDKQIKGISYCITDEIMDCIKNAGLVIADLSCANGNVYYEAGVAEGILQGKLEPSAKTLYIISNPKKPKKPFEAVKFDLKDHKIIDYANDGNKIGEFKEKLEKELIAFYEI